MTRRDALGVILLSASAALLAACGGPAATPAASTAPPPAAPPPPAPTQAPAAKPAAPAPTAAAPTSPAATVAAAATPAVTAVPQAQGKPAVTPKSGGTLRFGQIGDLVNLDPHFNQGSSENTWLPYDRLTTYDLAFKPQPMLAESWELSSDAKQVKVNLRKGVQFHSGREMTSDDVKYSILRVRDPKVGVAQYTAQSNWFQAVETPDKYTVVLKSDNPRPLVFDFFEVLNIADKDDRRRAGRQDQRRRNWPVCLHRVGPGRSRDLHQEQELLASAAARIWTPFGCRFLRDAQAMVIQFEAEALDLIRNPTKPDFARLRADPKHQAIQHPSQSWRVRARHQQSNDRRSTTRRCARRSTTRSTASASSTAFCAA